MTFRERMDAFVAGEKPDMIPYCAYNWFFSSLLDHPVLRQMLADGFGFTKGSGTTREEVPGLEVREDRYEEDGANVRRVTRQTPVGEIHATWRDGWNERFWLVNADDYRVAAWIAEHTQIEADYERYRAVEADAGPHEYVYVGVGRSPMQSILVDLVGLENFGAHLVEHEAEMRVLFEALRRNFARRAEIVAGGPGRLVAVGENFTAETMGPKRYAEFHLPVYEEAFPALHAAGKVVGVHYDGKLRSCRDVVAQAPFDLFESLTPPPEGDMTLAECRAAFPERRFLANINVGNYDLPAAELRQAVHELITQGSVDGRLLAFEISEDLPGNWAAAAPVILAAIREAAS